MRSIIVSAKFRGFESQANEIGAALIGAALDHSATVRIALVRFYGGYSAAVSTDTPMYDVTLSMKFTGGEPEAYDAKAILAAK